MMTGIFISYRREDSAGHAGRLFDRLTQHFGKGRVFMDVSDIEPGVDFVDAIDKAVGSCDALVVVIGRNWLTCVDAGGQRRLDDPNDFIRLETATALKRNIRVIPILVQGARMPKSEELPADLEKLARRQAIELSDTRWDSDVGQLIKALEAVLATEVERKSVSGQQETDTSRDKKADRKVITAVVSVVSVIALVVAGWLVWPRKVEVPRLTGNSMQGAKALLADRGLLAGIVNEEETERESPGMVLKQTPQAGERVEKGTKINLVLAIAPKVVVPDIIGKTFDQAATAVKTAGLNVGQRSSKQSSEAAAGIVLLQNPTAGTRVDKTVKVDVTVATTPRVVVPSTIGKT